MNKNNNQKNKLPRPIVIANNKKQAEIKNVLALRDEMIKNSIDPVLIKKFLDDQYDKINKEYENRIEKFNNTLEKKSENKIINDVKKKREKAVDFLLKNKSFLEEHGASKEYVTKYVEKQYQEINEYYDITNFKNSKPENNVDNNLPDFID